jgi:apolipoprotein N-acyltransferase
VPEDHSTDMRKHRSRTDRNLLVGFFALAFIVGGALIWWLYGSGAAALGILCVAGGAVLAGIVMGLMVGLQWLSDWLDRREMGE